METTQEQEFNLRGLPTRTVTVFPSRAQVIRDLKNVNLKPGINKITIVGLTPTVDEHSIKVEGTGSAIITDISTRLLPNQEIFDEIHPISDDEMLDEAKRLRRTLTSSQPAEAPSSPALLELKTDLDQAFATKADLDDKLKRAAENLANAERRLKMLDEFGAKFDPKSGTEIEEIIETYRQQRDAIFQDHMKGIHKEAEVKRQQIKIQTDIYSLNVKIEAERRRLSDKDELLAVKAAREARVESKRVEKRMEERARLRKELEKFWPKSTYTICITLDATHYTPISSRRSSIASVTDLMKPVEGKLEGDTCPIEETEIPACDLSISYVTSGAYWSPCYDMQLDTTNNTANLMFEAQLTNVTSETWQDCKIVLSTSQAVFGGLQDAIPKLEPWRIKLAVNNNPLLPRGNGGDITSSAAELTARDFQRLPGQSVANNSANRAAMFGISSNVQASQGQISHLGQTNPQMAQQPAVRSTATGGGSSGGALFGSGLFGGPARYPNVAQTFGQSSQIHGTHSSQTAQGSTKMFDAQPAPQFEPEPEAQLDFQQPTMEEIGLTTTYDLPGTKSLIPAFTPSKQRIARIAFTNVLFSHTIVAKLRPAAFLKARLRNASSMALLKGPVGLTLDGTFMGRSALPLCTSGDTFQLSLGVDPTIRVTYPKPDVKRSTTGVFTKENSTTYTRSVTITNTRTAKENSKAAHLSVRDQIPVSEDDKLRVEVLQPRGLVVGGAEVSGGAWEAYSKDWGKAAASLRKDGLVNWDVILNAGKTVKLTLEYDVSLPSGDKAVQAQEV